MSSRLSLCRESRPPRHPRDQGSMAVELVVLAPVLVLFALVALGLGRYELARERVVGATTAAAQAAAVALSATTAAGAAQAAVAPELTSGTHTCSDLQVTTDVSGFQTAGIVRVTVSCRVTFADLAIPGFPGSVIVRQTSAAPIDPYRVVG